MKRASLLELIAAAEKISSGELPAVQVPGFSSPDIKEQIRRLRERMNREKSEYLDSEPELVIEDDKLLPFQYNGAKAFLPRSEINALNQLIGYCNGYARTTEAPSVRFDVYFKDNHVNHIQLYGYSCVPSMLLDFPKLEGINLHGEPAEAYFPHMPTLEKLFEKGVRAFVKNREIFMAQNVLPVASRFGQAQQAAVPKPADPQGRRARLEMLITSLKAEDKPKYVQPALRNPPVVMSTIKPVEYSLPSFWERLGVAAFLFLGFSVGAAGLGVVGYNYFRQYQTRQPAIIEQSPESSTSIGSLEYKGLSYTVPYQETIAFDSVKKYDPEIVIKKQECSACDGRSRANPHHIDVHNIESLIIQGKPLDKIPDMMTGLRNLKLLEISESQITDVSPLYSSSARNLKALETLKLNNNRLTSLESNLCELPSLKEVWIANNPIDWNDPANKAALQKLEARGVKVYR